MPGMEKLPDRACPLFAGISTKSRGYSGDALYVIGFDATTDNAEKEDDKDHIYVVGVDGKVLTGTSSVGPKATAAQKSDHVDELVSRLMGASLRCEQGRPVARLRWRSGNLVLDPAKPGGDFVLPWTIVQLIVKHPKQSTVEEAALKSMGHTLPIYTVGNVLFTPKPRVYDKPAPLTLMRWACNEAGRLAELN